MLKQYQVYDVAITTLGELPVFSGNRPIDALKGYLSYIGENVQVKVSGDNDVRFGLIPCVIEDGRVYMLPKRRTWFKAVTRW